MFLEVFLMKVFRELEEVGNGRRSDVFVASVLSLFCCLSSVELCLLSVYNSEQ